MGTGVSLGSSQAQGRGSTSLMLKHVKNALRMTRNSVHRLLIQSNGPLHER